MRHLVTVSIFLGVVALMAAQPHLAAAESKAWGWRGDGSGRFPDADPPVKWGRNSVALKGLSTQAEKPNDGTKQGSHPAIMGNVPEWLVLGPFDFDPDDEPADVLNKEFVPTEAALKPGAGDKVGEVQWRKVSSNGSLLNMEDHFKDMTGKAFYAHAFLHSKDKAAVFARFKLARGKVWLNGTEIVIPKEHEHTARGQDLELRQGWNSLLVKVCSFHPNPMPRTGFFYETGYFQVALWGRAGDKYETDGILWEAALPRGARFSCAQPLVVGDRVFVNADPAFLIAFDKLTGKRLWTSYCGHSECVTDAERLAYPEVFKEVDPKVARLKTLAAEWTGTLAQREELVKLEQEVRTLLKGVDRTRYAGVAERQEAGLAGLTSCSDGKFIYTWFADGVAVCHDLDGQRRWITLENEGRRGGTDNDHHGYFTCPLLTDGEFVVRMRGTQAFDKATGKLLWKTGIHKDWPPAQGSPPTSAEGTAGIVYPEVGVHKPGVGFFPFSGECTRMGDRLYLVGCFHPKVTILELPQEPLPDKPLRHLGGLGGGNTASLLLPNAWAGDTVQGSVLVHDGLIYSVMMAGAFRAHDEQSLKLVYGQRVDLNTFKWSYPYPYGSGICASPTLGGKHIYQFGNGGSALVIKPGRQFGVVAENRIERLLPGHPQGGGLMLPSDKGFYAECTVSSPIFDGTRLYYQGEGYLYCIGKAK